MRRKSIVGNSWFKGITITLLGAFLGAFFFYAITEYIEQEKRWSIQSNLLTEARGYLEKCYSEDALKIYNELLREVTDKKIYSYIKNNIGICYYKLAIKEEAEENKKENLEKAIQAYKEALKYRSYKRRPEEYAETQNNLGDARYFFHLLNIKRRT